MPAGTTYDGSTRLLYFEEADAPESLDSITVADLADAEDFSGYLVAFNGNHTDDAVEGKDILTPFNNESVGRYGASPDATFKRKLVDGNAAAWDTLTPTPPAHKKNGVLVYFETLPDGEDPDVGDDYIAYIVQSGMPKPQPVAFNAEAKFDVSFRSYQPYVAGTLTAS